MFVLKIIPGDNKRLAYESFIDQVGPASFINEPDSGALRKSCDSVECVDRHSSLHGRIEFFQSSWNVLFDQRHRLIALKDPAKDSIDIDIFVVLGDPR